MRLQSDERLVALTRRGSQAAYEALVARYQSRLHAFCRHMLGSKEDAEDVLQEVFAAAYNAMVADERPINVRPWLYRIARNRSLNHLRRATAVGMDSMDVHLAEHGATTADKVHEREEFRQLVSDVQDLPETQRTALLLREIDALSYEQIAEAMETTVPSVKSLLVRARVSLAEAAEARRMSCADVREELGEVAEGLLARPTPPVRRHLRQCERCAGFRKQLRATNRALAAAYPVGPLLLLKKLVFANLGTTASAAGGGAAATAAGAGAGAASSSVLSAGVTAVASKAAAGLAAAAIVTAGAVEVDHARHQAPVRATASAPQAAPAPVVPPRPETVAIRRQPSGVTAVRHAAQPATAAPAKAAAHTASLKTVKHHAEPVVAPAAEPHAAPATTTTAAATTTAPQPTTSTPTTTTTTPAPTTVAQTPPAADPTTGGTATAPPVVTASEPQPGAPATTGQPAAGGGTTPTTTTTTTTTSTPTATAPSPATTTPATTTATTPDPAAAVGGVSAPSQTGPGGPAPTAPTRRP